jgi:uncharacterized protein
VNWVADMVQAGPLASVARDLAGRFADALRAEFGARVRRVTLYGSAARGDWTTESDVDVLVLLDGATSQDLDWVVRCAFRLGVVEQNVLLQPVVMTAEEFAHLLRRERTFALDVKAEGIPL